MKHWVWIYTRIEMDQESEEFGNETNMQVFAEKWMADQYMAERKAEEPEPDNPLYVALHSVTKTRIQRFRK